MSRLYQVDVSLIAIRTTPLTFRANVQLYPETEWASGDVGRYSQRDVPQGRFGWFLGFFSERGVHRVGLRQEGGSWNAPPIEGETLRPSDVRQGPCTINRSVELTRTRFNYGANI